MSTSDADRIEGAGEEGGPSASRRWLSLRPAVFCYAAAPVAVAIAFVARKALAPLLPADAAYLLFVPAVLAAAGLGGLGPGLVATAPWPKFEPSLLVEDMITLPVQVNGKKRGELTITVEASQADVERATLALEPVQRAQHRQPRVLYDLLGNRTTLDMRERQAQHHAAPALNEVVEDLLVAVV